MNFQEYSKLIPGTTVGMLSDDSGNVIELIQEAYEVKKKKNLYAVCDCLYLNGKILLDSVENSL